MPDPRELSSYSQIEVIGQYGRKKNGWKLRALDPCSWQHGRVTKDEGLTGCVHSNPDLSLTS